jgi:putative membrane-bound dehydrogenase-like protein
MICCDSSFAQGNRLSPDEALKKLTVADGLQVKTFAADPDIVSISNIDVDHRGRVWACECVNYRGNRGKRPEGDRILILEDIDGDGASDKTTVFYQGRDVDIAMGLCVLGNKAIVACSPNILLLEDTDGDDRADKKTVILTSDAEFQHDHSLHSFVFGPDGLFYGNFGNTGRRLKDAGGQAIVDRAGNEIVANGKPYHGGMVFRCDRNFANFEVLGHNFRNNYEATVDSFGGVWQSDNDDDGNLAVRLNYIYAGGNFGYLDELTGARWKADRIGAHPFRGKRHWHQNDPGVVPNVIETGNGAPTGVTVYEGDLLPAAFRNQVIFCDAGPHVVWSLPVKTVGAGFTASKVDILRSPDINFRPVDAAVAPDGSLFVSDWYDPVIGGFKQDDIERGRIYWIAPRGHKYSTPKYNFDTADGATEALQSPNYCARYLAWTHLHELGPKAEKPLAALLSDPNPRIRARALWLLGQIPGQETKYVEQAIRDQDADVRIVGIRLSDLLGRETLKFILQLTNDPSARVRAECALHLRHRHHDTRAVGLAWANLASRYDGKDRWYLEALGIGASGRWNACLSAYTQLGGTPTRGARNGLIWRSRSSNTAGALAEIVLAAKKDEDLRRYVRAFDFQVGESKDDALLSVAIGANVDDKIALAALQRVSASKLGKDDQRRKRLVELIKTTRGTEATPVSLIKQHRLTELYPTLLHLAQQESNDARVDAVVALLELEQQSLIRHALEGKDAARALATGRVLAQSQHPAAMALLLPFIQDEKLDIAARKEAARTLAKSDNGAVQLLELLENEKLNLGIREAIASVLLTHRNDSLARRAEKQFPRKPTRDDRPLPKLAVLISMNGDANSGRSVYLKQGKCANCHRAGEEGKAVGPNLDHIGTKLARPALFEAILYPNAAISHNYESYNVELKNGQVTTGVLISQSAQQIQLRDAEGILRTFDQAQVEAFEQLDISLMPADLHQSMTTQELVDLVDYLSTLKINPGE